MQRHAADPRPGWQAKVESQGLIWHTEGNDRYWDESAYYSFTMAEIEMIEEATEELYRLFLDAGDKIAGDSNMLELFGIPDFCHKAIRQSWKDEPPSLNYGRFDLGYNGTGAPKLFEFNCDTPTSMLEAGVIQWEWKEELFPDLDQFNSLHEKLVDRFREIFPEGGFVHFASDPDYVEDRQTVKFLEDLATQAGLEPQFVAIGDIGLNEDGKFVDHENFLIGAMFKLYPWEQMLRDDYAEPLPGADVTVLEPAWKSLLSNKGILPLLWERHAGHPNLLESYFETDPAHTTLGSSYVRKPLFSREGANVELVKDGRKSSVLDGGYGDGAWIRQALHAPPKFDNRYVIVGSWLVGNEPAGIGLREDRGRITRNTSRFLPHIIRG